MTGESAGGDATASVHETFCRATKQVEAEMSELIAEEGGWEEEYITKKTVPGRSS